MGISYCDHGWSVFNEEPCPECVAVRPTSNPPALPAGNLLADSYIADLAQLATERFPLDEEMRYYAGRLRNGVVKLLAERTALAAAEQRAAGLADKVAIYEAMLRVIEHDCEKCRADVQLAFAASAAAIPTPGGAGKE